MTMTQNEKAAAPVKGLDHYLNLKYPIELVEDEESFVASIPDLPGCFSYGDSVEEAIANLNATRRLWFQGAIESGAPIPEPTCVEDFSGKFVLRIPRTLHCSLDRESKKQGISLNQYLVHLLSERHCAHALNKKLEVLLKVTTAAVQTTESEPGWNWPEETDPGSIQTPRLDHHYLGMLNDVFGSSKRRRGFVVEKQLSRMKE